MIRLGDDVELDEDLAALCTGLLCDERNLVEFAKRRGEQERAHDLTPPTLEEAHARLRPSAPGSPSDSDCTPCPDEARREDR